MAWDGMPHQWKTGQGLRPELHTQRSYLHFGHSPAVVPRRWLAGEGHDTLCGRSVGADVGQWQWGARGQGTESKARHTESCHGLCWSGRLHAPVNPFVRAKPESQQCWGQRERHELQ